MTLEWNEYQKQLQTTMRELARVSHETVKGYQELGGDGATTGKLDAKTPELIALAVAVTLR